MCGFRWINRRPRRSRPSLRRRSWFRMRFRSGGASIDGEDRNQSYVADTMFTLKARPYAARRVAHDVESQRAGTASQYARTFTFTDLDAYNEGRPTTFTQRLGAQPLAFSVHQGGVFAQAEFARRRWNVGLGVRYEWQTGIDDRRAIAPRWASRGNSAATTGLSSRGIRMVLRVDAGTDRRRNDPPGAGLTGRRVDHQGSRISQSLRHRDGDDAPRAADAADPQRVGRAAAMASDVDRSRAPDPAGAARQRRQVLRAHQQRLPIGSI